MFEFIAMEIKLDGRSNLELKTEVLSRIDEMFNSEALKRMLQAYRKPCAENLASYVMFMAVQHIEKNGMVEAYFSQIDRVVPST